MFEKIDLTFDGLTILLTGYNQLIRKKQKPSLYSPYFWAWPHSLRVGWASIQGTLGLHGLWASTQSDRIYFPFLCPLPLIWRMGNIIFFRPKISFSSSSFPSLKSKFITRAWILKKILSAFLLLRNSWDSSLGKVIRSRKWQLGFLILVPRLVLSSLWDPEELISSLCWAHAYSSPLFFLCYSQANNMEEGEENHLDILNVSSLGLRQWWDFCRPHFHSCKMEPIRHTLKRYC